MAASAHDFASTARSSAEAAAGGPTPTSGFALLSIAAQHGPTGSQNCPSPPHSSLNGWPFSVFRVGARTAQRHQHITLQPPTEQRGLATSKEECWRAFRPVWSYVDPFGTTVVAPARAPLDGGGAWKTGGHAHLPRRPPQPSAQDCSLSLTVGVQAGAELPPAKNVRPIFLRPEVDAPLKVHVPPVEGLYTSSSTFPSRFHAESTDSVQSSGEHNNVTITKPPGAGGVPSQEESAAVDASSSTGVNRNSDGRASAAVPRRLQSSGLAVAFAEATSGFYGPKCPGGSINNHSVIASSNAGRRLLGGSPAQDSPVASSVAGAAPRATEAPTTKTYTVVMQQSPANGSHQVQVTASFAVPGAVHPRKVWGPARTPASNPSASASWSRPLCSGSALRPSTFLRASRNASPSAVFAERPRLCSPTCGGTADCRVLSVLPQSATKNVEEADARTDLKPSGIATGPQHGYPYPQGCIHTFGSPAFLQLPQWGFCPSEALRRPHRSATELAAAANAAGAFPLQPSRVPYQQSVHRQGEAAHTREGQHQQQSLQSCEGKCQQSAWRTHSTGIFTEQTKSPMAVGPTGDNRLLQRTRSHPSKVPSLRASPAERTSTPCDTQKRRQDADGCADPFPASHRSAGQANHQSAALLKTHCQSKLRHNGRFDCPPAQVLDTLRPASLTALPSLKDCVEQETASVVQVITEDRCGQKLPPGHDTWQQVQDNPRAGQHPRPDVARERAVGFGAAAATVAVAAVAAAPDDPSELLSMLSCSNTASVPADGGVRAPSGSSVAVSSAPAASIREPPQESHSASLFHQRRTDPSPAVMLQEKRAFSCEGQQLTRDEEVDGGDAAPKCATSSTSPCVFRCASSDSSKKSSDHLGSEANGSFRQTDVQEGSDSSDCKPGCQPGTETHACRSPISAGERLVQIRAEKDTEVEQDGTAGGTETGWTLSREERKGCSQQNSSSTSTNPGHLKQLQNEDAPKQHLTEIGTGGATGVLCNNCCCLGISDGWTADASSKRASKDSRHRMESHGSSDSDFGVALRGGTDGQDSREVPPWADDHWVALHFPAACCYSRPTGARDGEERERTLQGEDRAYRKGELASTRDRCSTGKEIPRAETARADDFLGTGTTVIQRILDSRHKRSNAHKTDGETRSSALPWKSVIVNTKNCRVEKALINTCAQRLGWGRNETDSFKGHIVWLGGSAPDFEHLHYNKPLQIINRFPGMWDMTKKRMLYRILCLYGQLFPTEYDFFPPCWSLPEDRCELSGTLAVIEEMLNGKNKKFYILKPDGGARGNGVQLVSLYKDIDPMVLRGDGSYIMQRYVENPYLLSKKKFDFRIYCVLFSVSGVPKAYVSKLGMVRFCTEEYQTPSRKNIDNPFMHLTNYSINKDNLYSFVRSTDLHDDSNSKRLLKDVFAELAQAGVDVDRVWQQIKSITAKTIVCLQPWLNLRYRHIYRGRPTEPSRCFQLLGLDILLDRNNKCWLLEVNSNPSLRIDYFDSKYDGIDVQLESAVDRHIKEPVVTEALALAYRVLLQQRQPYLQPLPRCCSGSKQSWYVRRLPGTAGGQTTGKRERRSRSQRGRPSTRTSNRCATTDGEEETETEEAVSTRTGTRKTSVGGTARGRGVTAAGVSKIRSIWATASTNRRKAGGSAAAAEGKAAKDTTATRCASSFAAAEEEKGASMRRVIPSGIDKKNAGAQQEQGDGAHKTGSPVTIVGTARAQHNLAARRLAGRRGGAAQCDCRSGLATASARSAPKMEQQRMQPSEKQETGRGRLGNYAEKQEESSADGRGGILRAEKAAAFDRRGSVRSRGCSAAVADRNHRKTGYGGGCHTTAVAGAARVKSKSRRNLSIYGAAGKQTEEEDEDYSDARVSLSPRRAVEEARKLLERLGSATALGKRTSEEVVPCLPEISGPLNLDDGHPSAASYTTAGRTTRLERGGANAASVASASGAFSNLRQHKCMRKTSSLQHVDPTTARHLCSDDVGEQKEEDRVPVQLPSTSPLPPSQEPTTADPTRFSSDRHARGERGECVRARQSADDMWVSKEYVKEGRPAKVATVAQTAQDTAFLLPAPPAPITGLAAEQQAPARRSITAVSGGYLPAASAATNEPTHARAETTESEKAPSRSGTDEESTFSAVEHAPTSPSSIRDYTQGYCCPDAARAFSAAHREDAQAYDGQSDVEHEDSTDKVASPLRSSTSGGRSSDKCECGSTSSVVNATTWSSASSLSIVSSYPPSPSSQSETYASDNEVLPASPSESPANGAAARRAHGWHMQHEMGGGARQRHQHSNREATTSNGDELSTDVCADDTSTSLEGSDKESRSVGAVHSETWATRLATEAEQLAVKLEWIEEAYREMEKCMDQFNILGLRFASKTVSTPFTTQHERSSGGNAEGRQHGDGSVAGAFNGKRGGGAVAGSGAGRPGNGKEAKRIGPYKPFLRKDKLASRTSNQTPPKSCYTKLHKDILHPLPPEYLKPQHCWVDLTASIAPLMERTACVLQMQLLFERIVGFPRLICLQREKLLEVCRLVKLPDVLRKVQVPISFSPTCRSASSRYYTSVRHVAYAPSSSAVSAARGGQQEAAGGWGLGLSRSNSGAWLTATANGGARGGGGGGTAAAGAVGGGAAGAAAAGGSAAGAGAGARESYLHSSCSPPALLRKRPHVRSSSSRTGSGSCSATTTPLSRSAAAPTTSRTGSQQVQQRQRAGCNSVSRLQASRAFGPGNIERRRRLGLPDVEVLFYGQLQGVRRQLQLQEASFGLGLLETWYLLEPIALVCYPFFPTKAKLLEAFMGPIVAPACQDKNRSSMQVRLSKSPAHADAVSVCRSKPRLEQMLQQLEEEERLAFAPGDAECAAAPERVRRGRGRSRCSARTPTATLENAGGNEANEKEAEAAQNESKVENKQTPAVLEEQQTAQEQSHFVCSSANILESVSAAYSAAATPRPEHSECTRSKRRGSAAAARTSVVSTAEEGTAAPAKGELTSERDLQAASHTVVSPLKSTTAQTATSQGLRDQDDIPAAGGRVIDAEAAQISEQATTHASTGTTVCSVDKGPHPVIRAEAATAPGVPGAERRGGATIEGNSLQEEAARQPLLYLWGQEQRQQPNYAEERDISTASTQPSAPAPFGSYPAATSSLCPTNVISPSSLCGGCSSSGGRSGPATMSSGAAAAERTRGTQKNKPEESTVLAGLQPASSAGGRGRDVQELGSLHRIQCVPPGTTASRKSSNRGLEGTSNGRSTQKGRNEEEQPTPVTDTYHSPPCGMSTAGDATAAAAATPASATPTTSALEVPEWHAGLCSAWPEDIWSYIRLSIPTEDRLAAMKRLVDYFHLRLDYCSFCALVPGGAGGGGKI